MADDADDTLPANARALRSKLREWHAAAADGKRHEVGTAFELLARAYLEQDTVQRQQYRRVIPYQQWAQQRGEDGRDLGIDLVAELADGGRAAIQCKCHAPDKALSKPDLDPFLAAASRDIFDLCVLVDTAARLNLAAEEAVHRLGTRFVRITRHDLERSSIGWGAYFAAGQVQRAIAPKPLRQHQKEAFDQVTQAFAGGTERGKMVMACGTGKTLVALRIAEQVVKRGGGGRVLYCVPSLALMSQTLRAWADDAELPLRSLAVCSDSQVGRRRRGGGDSGDDPVDIDLSELAYPATTRADRIAQNAKPTAGEMLVIFATYHSIQVVIEAQQQHGLHDFDLIICDEAHRTTGATLQGQNESSFVKVHDGDQLYGKHRLYMTATPRIFGEAARKKAGEKSVELASMDDVAKFGPLLFSYDFGQAVQDKVLSDYKVIVLAMDEAEVSLAAQKRLGDDGSELQLDDATRIVGCHRALSGGDMAFGLDGAMHKVPPMRRALAFCRTISTSKLVMEEFNQVIREVSESGMLPAPPVPGAAAKGIGGEESATTTTTPPQAGAGVRPGPPPAAPLPASVPPAYQLPPRHDGVATGGHLHPGMHEPGAAYDAGNTGGHQSPPLPPDPKPLQVAINHVDGTMGAHKRNEHLDWLRGSAGNECRILSNVRCLSEGVDVPALDAIIFMHPRQSQIDVVQAVGRVMRKAPGKEMGYVILPVGIPAGVRPEDALDNNERYRVVWQILNALRAHDSRLQRDFNQARLGQPFEGRVAVVAEVGQLPSPPPKPGADIGGNGTKGGKEEVEPGISGDPDPELPLQYQREFQAAVYARLVARCGSRAYWGDWGSEVGKIARTLISRINGLLDDADSGRATAFAAFHDELRSTLNDGITRDDAIEMLAQHLVTKPVFTALFGEDGFVRHNPVSRALDRVVQALAGDALGKETRALSSVYAQVQGAVDGITEPKAQQKLVKELYESFFKTAFPKIAERLGIVYTPVEVVDFILKSADDMCRQHFGKGLTDRDVHVLDPFTGTGTFIARLLQSGLIGADDLMRKYRHEIHANEIVPLAYYVAAANIESSFRAVIASSEEGAGATVAAAMEQGASHPTLHEGGGSSTYIPFSGLCFVDTFTLDPKSPKLPGQWLKENNERLQRQERTGITVILGNPPYSVGQKRANDNAPNQNYPDLDARIRERFAQGSSATNLNSLYDSYIRALRWALDRLAASKRPGLIAFVTNAAWVERNFADSMRKALEAECFSLHVLHLRGDVRKDRLSGGKAGEGGNVFGQASQTGAAVALLVHDPDAAGGIPGAIHFHDIGDNLTGEAKLERLGTLAGAGCMDADKEWQRITPDAHGDWLNQRDPDFARHPPMGSKARKGARAEPALFATYSSGLKTNRDAWCVNQSRRRLQGNVARMVQTYNAELQRWRAAGQTGSVRDFVTADKKSIAWDRELLADLKREKTIPADEGMPTPSIYRPFTRTWCHYSRRLNNMVYQLPQIFPFKNNEIPPPPTQWGSGCWRGHRHTQSRHLRHWQGGTKRLFLPDGQRIAGLVPAGRYPMLPPLALSETAPLGRRPAG